MCNLFNFDAPTAVVATATVEQPAVSEQEAGYLADGQSGPLVRINALVASALFDPEGPGFDAPNWVIVSGMRTSKFVIVNTDQSPRPEDITHPNGWKVYFRKYVGDMGVVPYTPSPATQKAIDAVCLAHSEEEIMSIVMDLGSAAAVDAAMLGVAAGFRCVDLASIKVTPEVDREAAADIAANTTTAAVVEGEAKVVVNTADAPASNTDTTSNAPADAPAIGVTLAVVQGMLNEAVRDNKTLAKHANEAARLYTTIPVDDVVGSMLEALISLGDRNRLRKLVRAIPEAVTEVTA